MLDRDTGGAAPGEMGKTTPGFVGRGWRLVLSSQAPLIRTGPQEVAPREAEGWGLQRRDRATERKGEDGATQRTSSPPVFQDCDFSVTCGFSAGPAQAHPGWHSWGIVPLSCGGPVTVWTVSHPPADGKGGNEMGH